MDISPRLETTYIVPEHVTASAFSAEGQWLVLGSDDGTVRFYQPPDPKVKKAIRRLGSSVSSVVYQEKDGRSCWVAAGRNVYRFDTTISKMICISEDATFTKEVGEDEDSTLNQIALNPSDTYLAITGDAGSVWVLDIKVGELSKMRTSHSSIAWTAAFIPDRPSELISGGYDCTILHFDFKQGTLLGRFEISPSPGLAPGISSLPPFITSLVVSSSGTVAAGTADGRIWVGLGGEKTSSQESNASKSKKKRTRKWGGLNAEDGFETKAGHRLITGLTFTSSGTLLSCSLNGEVIAHEIVRTMMRAEEQIRTGGLREVEKLTSENCTKVDTLSFSALAERFVMGGLYKDTRRGVLELWSLSSSESMPETAEVTDG